MHTVQERPSPITKLETGLPGFDIISDGGLPRGRTTLVTGTAGSAKTVFAVQFLAAGIISADEPGVFVTFEDTPQDIRINMASFGWDIARWEQEGKWAFVDASPRADEQAEVVGSYDLGGLMARIERAVQRTRARRVSLDSVNGLFAQFSDHAMLRSELSRIITALKSLGVTTILTAERLEDYGPVSRHGIEEFVADNVIILRNLLNEERRRRTIEILKFRGAAHQRGEFPFTVDSHRGIIVIPLSAMELTQQSSEVRISSGLPELDRMTNGGFFRDSIILISGATGTGKTLTVTHFIQAGVGAGERCILFAFEESREQLCRNARSWGIDLEGMEREGLLKVIPVYPHAMPIEDHLLRLLSMIEEFEPRRVVVDSLSAIERTTAVRSYREFIINLTSFIKKQEITGLFTATATGITGGTTVTEKHISTLTDTIVLLRYVELHGQMHRGVLILKMRGSGHDPSIREFTIDASGMHIGEPYRRVSGILSGTPSRVAEADGGDPALDLAGEPQAEEA